MPHKQASYELPRTNHMLHISMNAVIAVEATVNVVAYVCRGSGTAGGY
jgi:hypothetical protein